MGSRRCVVALLVVLLVGVVVVLSVVVVVVLVVVLEVATRSRMPCCRPVFYTHLPLPVIRPL